MAEKSLQEHFREQAELIDKLFAYRFDEFDKRWDAKLEARVAQIETKIETKIEKLEQKLEQKFEQKLEPIRNEITAVNKAVQIILTRLN